MPTRDMTFQEAGRAPLGRFKMWVHYSVLHPYVLPHLPSDMRVTLFKASRRWIYGPNANNEDLIDLIKRLSPE